LQLELKKKEGRSPNSFLSTNYKLKYKVFSGKDQIDGKIYNSARIATFKNIQLRITFMSNTGASLGYEDYILYKYIKPKSSVTYQIKIKSPSATKKIGVIVSGASSAD